MFVFFWIMISTSFFPTASISSIKITHFWWDLALANNFLTRAPTPTYISTNSGKQKRCVNNRSSIYQFLYLMFSYKYLFLFYQFLEDHFPSSIPLKYNFIIPFFIFVTVAFNKIKIIFWFFLNGFQSYERI